MYDFEKIFIQWIKNVFIKDIKVFSRGQAGKVFQDQSKDIEFYFNLNIITKIPTRNGKGFLRSSILYPEDRKDFTLCEYNNKYYYFHGKIFSSTGTSLMFVDKDNKNIFVDSKKSINKAINELDFQEITR